MGKREQTIDTILQTTMKLLASEGLGKLSMRRVANESSVSLSNLQYYFKDIEALLITVVANYFEWCAQEVQDNISNSQDARFETFLRNILTDHLVEGGKTDRCIMFREIWALSSRSTAIDTAVNQYYNAYCKQVVSTLANYSAQPAVVAALLLPYVEGYSIMGNSLTLDKKQVMDSLIAVIVGLG
ncbi:TetR/AcrR family transcriptional regulator [Reichenbachiella agariperforans]|uniref:TetR/AcrR family transcriptional regulator n=1 Tax=Reichenbachiella agariperforans TaxID=156994 RepID=UPI001C085928|nr:TetR/AcrR family transcriptional regulator [Reichenbachiella agariperforans]MBU2913059.1 TetR/AcrR family transcriptional regulator [Reichenbachiella agariperforans]